MSSQKAISGLPQAINTCFDVYFIIKGEKINKMWDEGRNDELFPFSTSNSQRE